MTNRLTYIFTFAYPIVGSFSLLGIRTLLVTPREKSAPKPNTVACLQAASGIFPPPESARCLIWQVASETESVFHQVWLEFIKFCDDRGLKYTVRMLTPTLEGSVITYEVFIFPIFLFVFLYSERTLNKLLSDVLDERAGGFVSSSFLFLTYVSNLHVHSKVLKIIFL